MAQVIRITMTNRRQFITQLFTAALATAVAKPAELLTIAPAPIDPMAAIESVIRTTINPIITQQFEQAHTLYHRFIEGDLYYVNSNGYRIPFQSNEQ